MRLARQKRAKTGISIIEQDGVLFVDAFAGGGGASTGVEMAIGRSVDVAINHNPAAIAMHAKNHPDARHYIEDVFQVDPVEACRGKRPKGMWMSPDCFPAGTLILAKSGLVPIENLKIGDEVLTPGSMEGGYRCDALKEGAASYPRSRSPGAHGKRRASVLRERTKASCGPRHARGTQVDDR